MTGGLWQCNFAMQVCVLVFDKKFASNRLGEAGGKVDKLEVKDWSRESNKTLFAAGLKFELEVAQNLEIYIMAKQRA